MTTDASPDPQRAAKRRAAAAAVTYVQDGMRLGLGSGSTAELMVELLGERIAREKLSLMVVATSPRTEALARAAGMQVVDFSQVQALDLALDGADEVDGQLDLIKGRGGALLYEKIVAEAAREFIVMVDASKRVDRLGRGAVPIEVVPFAEPLIRARMLALGATVVERVGPTGEPYRTTSGHVILDANFTPLEEAAALAELLAVTPGVVDHGLFLGLATRVLVGDDQGVTTLEREGARRVPAEIPKEST